MRYELQEIVLYMPEGGQRTFKKFFFGDLGISDIDNGVQDILHADGRKIEVHHVDKLPENKCILFLKLQKTDGYQITHGEYSSVSAIERNGVQCGHIPDDHPDWLYLG